jgi:hypothetical protein
MRYRAQLAGLMMIELMAELEARWDRMFCALAAGEDVPPAQRLRAEGIMESAVLLGFASRESLQQDMDECYQRAFGRPLAADFGSDWCAFFPFPQIPAMARRAPVYPSTSE